MGCRRVSDTASAVTRGTADGNNKSQRRRTNVNWKNSTTDSRASCFRICSLGRLNKSRFLFIFSDYLCIISILTPTFGSRVRTVARLAVWETLPGLNDVNPLFTQNREHRKI